MDMPQTSSQVIFLHAGQRLEQRPQFPAATEAPFEASGPDEVELLDFDDLPVEIWLETQLLDCQNLARQHHLPRVAAALDAALDLLAQDAPVASVSLR